MRNVAPSQEPYEAERREQKLVRALRDHLVHEKRHDVARLKIVPPGEAKPLFSDLYDATDRLLVEAKGTVERGAIRMAIGQLADYKRFVNDGPARVAMLLPERPRPDLCALLEAEGIELIFPLDGGFATGDGEPCSGSRAETPGGHPVQQVPGVTRSGRSKRTPPGVGAQVHHSA